MSRKKRRRAVRPLSLFLLGLSLAALVWAVWPVKYRLEQRRKMSELKKRVAILKQENKDLREEIDKLNSDEYIEMLARRDLGLVKPGEEAYVVASSEDESEEQGASPKPKQKKETIWDRVVDFLEGVFR